MTITYAQPQDGVVSEETDTGAQAADALAIASYWTATKMANAKLMPTPTEIVDSLSLAFPPLSEESGELAVAGYAPGCRPNATSNCNNAPRTLSSQNTLSSESAAYGDRIQPLHGTKPTNPLSGPYGPFQRWREATPDYRLPQIDYWKIILQTQ